MGVVTWEGMGTQVSKGSTLLGAGTPALGSGEATVEKETLGEMVQRGLLMRGESEEDLLAWAMGDWV